MSETAKSERRYIYSPRVDICDKDKEIILTAEVPGVDEKDIEITLEGDILTLFGHVEDDTLQGYKKIYAEYGTLDYKRIFKLSDVVDKDHIEASLKNGILTITLQKTAKANPQKIEIKAAA